MAAKAAESAPKKRKASAPQDVESFLASLDHPYKDQVIALRRIILDADPAIAEEIKWNAPSFYTSEHFATMHLRGKEGAQVILHLGAKKRETATSGITIADPASLLEWLAPDRAMTKFQGVEDINAKGSAFTDILRQWITYV